MRMSNLLWLMAANAVVWLGIGVYVAFLARAQAALDRRLRHMEMIDDA